MIRLLWSHFIHLPKNFVSTPFFLTKNSSGFTLIELIIVIGIVALLAVAIVLTLNPTELLKQSRDAARVSDLAVLKKAISLYLVDVKSPVVSSSCAISASTSAGFAGINGGCGTQGTARYTQSSTPSSQSGSYSNNGTGWVPINLTAIGSGAPISHLPRDPSNVSSTGLYYSYVGISTSTLFELDAEMESSKYRSGGTHDVESKDGGSSSTLYEVGTSLSL